MSERVYTAVVRDDQILMVRHVHDGRDYWTLPGGHIEPGEEPIVAAQREVAEETGIQVVGLRELFRDARGICFVGRCAADAVALVGSDPELASDAQVIKDVGWFDLADKADDWQVSLVVERLP